MDLTRRQRFSSCHDSDFRLAFGYSFGCLIEKDTGLIATMRTVEPVLGVDSELVGQ